MQLKNIISPDSLSGTGFISVLITILIIAPTLGAFWIYSEISQKKEELVQTEAQHTQFYKTILSNDVNGIMNFIEYKRSNTESRVKKIVKERVQHAYALASHIYSMEKDLADYTTLSTKIIETLRPLRWNNGRGYFFVLDYNGSILLNADRPDLENQGTRQLKDIEGRHISRDILNLVEKNDSGFYTYRWSKPGAPGLGHIKITYVKNFKPLNWVICAGFYLEDMEDSIRKEILDRISQLTGNEDQYTFVISQEGFCIYHPLEKFHRKNILNHQTSDGRFIIREIIQNSGQENGFFIQYPWEKPSTGKAEEKIIFAQKVPDWGWTIGKGIYLDEIKGTIALEKQKFKSELTHKLMIIIGLALLIVIFSLIMGVMVTGRLYKGISAFTDFFKKAAVLDIKIDVKSLVFKEFKLLGTLANQMVEDRIQKENSLRNAMLETVNLQNLLKNITDSMPSCLIAIDQDKKIVHWNKKAELTTQIRSKDAEGRIIDDVLPLSARETGMINETLKSGKPSIQSRKTRQSASGKIHEEMIIYPLNTGKTNGAVIRIDDTTEKVRIEEMMIQSEKMLSVGGLAAGMAHEINNPLSGIIGNLDVLKNRLLGDFPVNIKTAQSLDTNFKTVKAYAEERRLPDLIENIRKAGSRAAKIVADMLSFSRMSTSNFTECDIAELLDKTLDLVSTTYDLKKKFDFKQIKIIKKYAAEMPRVICEGSKLQQVFLNILTNGAYAMSDNPKEKPPAFILTVDFDDRMAVVEISDNGTGIPEEICKRIFEPFFTTKEIGIGTGLGLSVSYFIITDHHNGSLEVESKPDIGTTFIIRIPLTPSDT